MLTIARLNKFFLNQQGQAESILHDINFELSQGEFVAIVGHSGSGKTTLLKCLAGLESCQSESFEYHHPITTAVVFQEPRLLPHYSVEKNLRLAFAANRRNDQATDQCIHQQLSLVGLSDYADNFPSELSGGMAQRAAIARALCRKPDVLFMDEPFSALDIITRQTMQKELKTIHKTAQCSVIFITHDIQEAITLADRIVVMNKGRITEEFSGDTLSNAEQRIVEATRTN
ncbi:ABC transporter ATP-binding protein [Vibrio tapetis]|uniref:Taurine-transporting AtPase n=1 Tax=Vibrio tapetis subsp. tapetis TaxID=1671868 RepID=A0A2N8ZGZ7_9VIBR|nr:ABC transporter ATP-binding protein [Vibrio tapetis]SON51170.1 Taurine-transporting AtPase [Vibrio tapetis subsp. tapetis]